MVKRRRKPMTEEQRAAAAERLRVAREKRGHDGSASVNESIRGYDEDHPLHWKKVKVWIKEITTELSAKKSLRDSKDAKQRMEYLTLQTYLGNLKKYLDTGVYFDARYGRHREGRMNTLVTTMAYHPDGRPKRTVGHIYPDCGEYTMEMKQYDDRVYGTKRQRRGTTEDTVYEQEEILEDGGESGS